MKPAELKAYLATLKGYTTKSKTTPLPVLRGVAKRGDTLTTTELDHYCELKVATSLEDGFYDDYALDLLTTKGVDTELTKSAEWGLDDYPELQVKEWDRTRCLTQLDIDHIIEAVECVSKDTTRPALTLVAIDDNLIAGTDGYVLYATTASPELRGTTIFLDAKMVATLKRLRKYGSWEIRTAEDGTLTQITNGTLTLTGRLPDIRYPAIRTLLDKTKVFSTSVVLDFATISALANKDRDTLDINPMTGEVLLESHPTGVVARTYGEQRITRAIETDTRRVIMPKRGEDGHITLSVAFLKRLNRKQQSITLLTNLNSFDMIEVL